MEWPWPSVMPEAVLNSVSIRSEITGARAGIRAFSSASLALCHVAAYAAVAVSRTNHKITGGLCPLIKMHNPPLQRGGGSLGAIGDPQLAEQAVDVGFHRGFRNEKRGGNFLVAVAAHNQLQHLGLSPGQRGPAHAFRQTF